jgi:hypothetical protein
VTMPQQTIKARCSFTSIKWPWVLTDRRGSQATDARVELDPFGGSRLIRTSAQPPFTVEGPRLFPNPTQLQENRTMYLGKELPAVAEVMDRVVWTNQRPPTYAGCAAQGWLRITSRTRSPMPLSRSSELEAAAIRFMRPSRHGASASE